MASKKGKGKQKAAIRSSHLPPPRSHKNLRNSRGVIREDLSARIVDWDDLDEEQQKEYVDTEFYRREAEAEAEYKKPVDDLANKFQQLNTMADPAQASGSTLPEANAPAQTPITLENLTYIVGQMSIALRDLGQHTQDIAQQVAAMANAQAIYMTAAASVPPGNPNASTTTRTAPGGSLAVGPPAHHNHKDIVSKPKPWNGKDGSVEARHFLAAFSNWAFHTESALNDWNATTRQWQRNSPKWIQAVLNLMGDDARTWALPKLEELRTGVVPFAGSWGEFEDSFTRRFIPYDVSEEAREQLKKLKQGQDSVPAYMAKFDQHTSHTGWSPADHRQRFYDGLNE